MTPRKTIAYLLFFLFSVASFAQKGWKEGQMEILVTVRNTSDAAFLKEAGIDFEAASPDGSKLYAYVVPKELEKIRDRGLHYIVRIPDLNAHYRANGSLLVPPGYYTYDQIVAIADSLATNFPSICRKTIIGTSADGHQLGVLKISDNVNVNENEPEILFDGGIHGDEVGGPENMIRYARDLCLGYGTNPELTNLVNTREIWIYYMVNPDGRVTMSRYNGNGIDINRDAGYMWNAEGFSTGAFSQPESKTLRQMMFDNHFVIYTNYHSGTEIISYPWSYRADLTTYNYQLNYIAGVYSSTAGYNPPLTFGPGYTIMYAINGSYKDVQYGCLGNVGWSIEISNDKQPPSSMISTYYNYNKPAMTEMVKRAGWGLCGMITDSLTGVPIPATVWVNTQFPMYNDPVVGDYHKYETPGTYLTVRVTGQGYKSKTITNVLVPNVDSVVNNFQLVPDTGRYVYRVAACQIPNNNFSDPGNTQNVLGAPDNAAYAMGRNGWIVLDMGDTVVNGAGPDIRIFEANSMQRGYTVYASTMIDGPWTSLGNGTGTATFDLTAAGLQKSRYIKIKDDGDGSSTGNGIGFNLDAVQNLHPILTNDFTASTFTPCTGSPVAFSDLSAGNPTSWHWSFPGGTPAASTQKNPSVTYAAPGNYDVTLTISNGFSVETRTKTALIHADILPGKPAKPAGHDTVHELDTTSYITNASTGNCLWIVNPSTAATINGSGDTATIAWSGSFTGTAWLKVAAISGCGTGFFSDSLKITVLPSYPTGINGQENTPHLFITPNPAKGSVMIDVNGFTSGRLDLVDYTGKTVRSVQIHNGKNILSLDLTGISAGLYFVVCSDGRQRIVQKLVIQ
jgi:PKD repeat protein